MPFKVVEPLCVLLAMQIMLSGKILSVREKGEASTGVRAA